MKDFSSLPASDFFYRGRSLARDNLGIENALLSVRLLFLFRSFQAFHVMSNSALLVTKQALLWDISKTIEFRKFTNCRLYCHFLLSVLEAIAKWASPVLSAYLIPPLLLFVTRINCWSTQEENAGCRPSLRPLLLPIGLPITFWPS